MIWALTIIGLLVAYCYLLYPAGVWLWARMFGRPLRGGRCVPSVTLIIPAHCEEEYIEKKIRSVLALDYPADRLDVIVVSDGSTDRTVEIAGRFAGERLRVVALSSRGGKPLAMNHGLAEARGEVVAFTDASGLLEKESLRALMRNFFDEEAGCVSGVLLPPEDSGVGRSMGLYRRYENFLRRCESRVHSSLGATGALFAVRRELLQPLAPDTILDDLAIPLKVIRQGRRIVMEPAAVCVEQEETESGREFVRKVRTLAGNYQAFLREPRLLVPFAGPVWFMALSHKILRLFSPFLIAAFAALSIVWAAGGGGTAALLLVFLQAAFFGLALCGAVLQRSVLCHLYTFCLLQAACVAAFFKFFLGRSHVLWPRDVVEAGGDA